MFALNKRLAIVNGGTKLGRKNAALPSGPRHICNAFVTVLEPFDFDIEKEIDLILLFEKFVLSEVGEIYDEFNTLLSEAGILPNLLNEYGMVVDSRVTMRHRAASEASRPPYRSTPSAFQQAQSGFTPESPNRYAPGADDAYGQ